MAVVLGMELWPALKQITKLLDECSDGDPVMQQKLLELACARHALRMGSKDKARFVLNHLHRHAVQILEEPPVDAA